MTSADEADARYRNALAHWIKYLEHRGIIVERGTAASLSVLFRYGAEGLYDLKTKTIYLQQMPSRSAFYEEAFHALQHRAGLPDVMTFRQGNIERVIDRWEYDAKRVLMRHRRKLGISNSETRVTIRHLRRLQYGYY